MTVEAKHLEVGCALMKMTPSLHTTSALHFGPMALLSDLFELIDPGSASPSAFFAAKATEQPSERIPPSWCDAIKGTFSVG